MSMSAPHDPASLDSEAREALNRLADLLIPPHEKMPSASEADADGVWVDRALQARPDLIEPFNALLRELQNEPPEQAIRRLDKEDPERFALLTEIVAGAYFMNPKVRDLLGYPGQRAIPVHDMTEELDELVAPVMARGPIYRPTSD